MGQGATRKLGCAAIEAETNFSGLSGFGLEHLIDQLVSQLLRGNVIGSLGHGLPERGYFFPTFLVNERVVHFRLVSCGDS